VRDRKTTLDFQATLTALLGSPVTRTVTPVMSDWSSPAC